MKARTRRESPEFPSRRKHHRLAHQQTIREESYGRRRSEINLRIGAGCCRGLLADAEPAPSNAPESFWRDAQFDTIRLCLIKVAGRVTELVTRIKIALPTAYPYQIGFATLAGSIAKLPP